MLPLWLAITIVIAFPILVPSGYTLAHVLAGPLSARAGFLVYLALLCVPLAAVLANNPACADGLYTAPLAWMLTGVVTGAALWLLQLSLPGKAPDASSTVYTGPPGQAGFALVMLPVALIVLAEEIIWRGFLLPRLTAIPAAIAFSLHHAFFGLRHVAFSFLAGLAWGGLFIQSGSLWPSIVSHLLYNALAWTAMRRSHHLHRNPPCSAEPSSPPPPSP